MEWMEFRLTEPSEQRSPSSTLCRLTVNIQAFIAHPVSSSVVIVPTPSSTASSRPELHCSVFPPPALQADFLQSSKIQTKLCSLFLSSGVLCDQQLPTHSDCSGGSASSSSSPFTATAASGDQHGSASSQPAPCGESTRKVKWPPGKGWAELVVEGDWLELVIQKRQKCPEVFLFIYLFICIVACAQQWSLVSVEITGLENKVFLSVAPLWPVASSS